MAEDDRLARKAVTHFLEKEGHTVTEAARQGDLESCQHLFQDLEPRMNGIVQYIESIISENGGNDGKTAAGGR